MRSTGPEEQAAFNAPYFLHRIMRDFRQLGDNGDPAKFLNQQRKNLRKHDKREAGKNWQIAPTGPIPESAKMPVPNPGQQANRVERESAVAEERPTQGADSVAPAPRPTQAADSDVTRQKPADSAVPQQHSSQVADSGGAPAGPVTLSALRRLSTSPPVAGPGPKMVALALASAPYIFEPRQVWKSVRREERVVVGKGKGKQVAAEEEDSGEVRRVVRRKEPVGKGKGKEVAAQEEDSGEVRKVVRRKEAVGKGKGKAVESQDTQPTR